MAVNLAVKSREVFGNRLAKLRQQGQLPANIVKKGQTSQAIEISGQLFTKVMDQVGYTQPIELTIDKDQKTIVLIDSVQRHPVSQDVLHVVFVAVKAGETVSAQVPLELVGDSPGVQVGLMLLQSTYNIEVQAKALKIPESIPVDISDLKEAGQVLRVQSLQLPDEVTTIVDPETVIARLEMSRSQVSAEQEEPQEDQEEGKDGEQESESEGDKEKEDKDKE